MEGRHTLELALLYSAGECPVCSDSGAVLVLKARGTADMFVFCPLCGVAWREPPPDGRLDTILGLSNFAPDGVALPTAAEALRTGFSLTEVPLEEWYPLLKEFLLLRQGE